MDRQQLSVKGSALRLMRVSASGPIIANMATNAPSVATPTQCQKCFKKAAQAAQSQSGSGESAGKGADTSDTGKHATMVRHVPKRGEGQAA